VPDPQQDAAVFGSEGSGSDTDLQHEKRLLKLATILTVFLLFPCSFPTI
jgi:hypothetical protein